MNATALLSDLTRRGVRLEPRLHIEAPPGELNSVELDAVRVHKRDLLHALLSSDLTALPANQNVETLAVIPDSRHPLIALEVRAKIEVIEPNARRLGWPAELLWNAGFWDCPRGLAAVLDPEDDIAEVTPNHISILKVRRHLVRFCRYVA